MEDADLTLCDLRGAKFTKSILKNVRMRRADLSAMPLRDAAGELTGRSWPSTLAGANLAGADLTDADLRGVNLNGANMTDAKLTRTKLDGAIMKDVTLGATDIVESLARENADVEK